MKVPASSPQTNKPISCNRGISSSNSSSNNNNKSGTNITFLTNNTPNLCYEPTSVLDLRRSPSPASGKPASTTDPLEWDHHVLQTLDWDSIMRELDFHEDYSPALIKNFPQFGSCESQFQNQSLPEFTPPPHIDHNQFLHTDFSHTLLNSIQPHNLVSLELSHTFHNNISNWNYIGFDLIQELIRAADCFDSNELQLAQAILERLNQRLQTPIGKPLQRAAFFFKEALHSLLTTGSTHPPTRSHFSCSDHTVQTIKAYKAFFSISPIPMFIDFTTNQALLECLDESSPPFIHVIDFDIGFGCQYASLMRELVDKADSFSKLTLPLLRISAIIPEEYAIETKLIKERLFLFAQELKIRFHIDFVLISTFEMLSFKAIKFAEGEKTAVLLSPMIFRRLACSTNNVTIFVNDLRRISPNVVVFVDNEGWWPESGGGSSFRRNFVNCLEFYSMIFESLDAATAGGDWARKIEMFLLKPRIMAAVEGCGRRVAAQPWREVFCGAGMKAVPLSQFADFQAESLLGKVQVRGFDVAKRQAELVLCWHGRPLIATSVWQC